MGKDIRQFMTMFGVFVGEAGEQVGDRLFLKRPLKIQLTQTDVLFNKVFADEKEIIIPLGSVIEIVLETPIKDAYEEAAMKAYSGLILAR